MPADLAGLPVRPATNVLRATDLKRWLDGATALVRAEAEAAAIVAAAAAAYKTERERGYAEGREAAAIELARALARTHGGMEAALMDMEAALPALVTRIVEDILGTFDARELTRSALRRALERVRRGADAVLRVAPESVEIAQETLGALGLSRTIRLEPDPALEAGRCVFESSLGKAELGIEAQLRVLRDTLTERWQVAA